jgi:TRAP-type C4-dicarboxylate transport system permease small subunit
MASLVALTRRFASFIQGVTAVLLLIAVTLNFLNVTGRYVFGAPIFWAEEVMLFLLVAIVFLGNSVVGWEGKQLRMDVVLHLLPHGWRRALEILSDLAVIAVSLFIAWSSFPVIQMLAEFGQNSQVAEVPLVIPQVLIPIGLVLAAVFVAIRLLARPEARP